MSDIPIPTSPTLPTEEGVLRTAKDFAGALTLELSDEETLDVFELYLQLRFKFMTAPDTPQMMAHIEDEVSTRFAELGVLAKFDPTDRAIDILGKISGDPIHVHGFDHERKEWEVKHATERNEEILGLSGKTPKARQGKRNDKES